MVIKMVSTMHLLLLEHYLPDFKSLVSWPRSTGLLYCPQLSELRIKIRHGAFSCTYIHSILAVLCHEISEAGRTKQITVVIDARDDEDFELLFSLWRIDSVVGRYVGSAVSAMCILLAHDTPKTRAMVEEAMPHLMAKQALLFCS